MKLKDHLLHTDQFLLAGLFLGVIKVGTSSMSATLPVPEWLDNLLILGMCGCYGIHVLLQRPGILRIMAYGAAALAGMYSALRSGDMNGMITLLTCIALAGSDFDRIIPLLFRWNVGLFLVQVSYSAILALTQGPNGPLIGPYHGDIVLHLGYIHKNAMAMHLVNILLMWTWMHFREIRIKHLALIMAAATFFLLVSQCKTAYLLVAAMCLMVICFNRMPRHIQPLVQACASWCTLGICLFTMVCVYLFPMGNPIISLINDLITGRIHLGYRASQQYGLTFFGHLAEEVAMVENRVALMDNVYIYAMFQIGALWAIAFCIAFFLVPRRTKDVRVYFCIFCWGLYSMTEFPVINGFLFLPALLPALLLAPAKEQPATSLESTECSAP